MPIGWYLDFRLIHSLMYWVFFIQNTFLWSSHTLKSTQFFSRLEVLVSVEISVKADAKTARIVWTKKHQASLIQVKNWIKRRKTPRILLLYSRSVCDFIYIDFLLEANFLWFRYSKRYATQNKKTNRYQAGLLRNPIAFYMHKRLKESQFVDFDSFKLNWYRCLDTKVLLLII